MPDLVLLPTTFTRNVAPDSAMPPLQPSSRPSSSGPGPTAPYHLDEVRKGIEQFRTTHGIASVGLNTAQQFFQDFPSQLALFYEAYDKLHTHSVSQQATIDQQQQQIDQLEVAVEVLKKEVRSHSLRNQPAPVRKRGASVSEPDEKEEGPSTKKAKSRSDRDRP